MFPTPELQRFMHQPALYGGPKPEPYRIVRPELTGGPFPGLDVLVAAEAHRRGRLLELELKVYLALGFVPAELTIRSCWLCREDAVAPAFGGLGHDCGGPASYWPQEAQEAEIALLALELGR